jgi:glucose-6-phosphate isomerase
VTNTDPDLWPADDAVAGVLVTAAGPAAITALDTHLPSLVSESVASRLAAGDDTLWGPQAQPEASIRLGWVGLAETSRPLVVPIERLRAELLAEGVDRVVLCGMGGSSLAPEVITAAAGVPLVVLDGTDPGQVTSALTDLERTVIVVSSKSGSTVETDSQRRTFEAAFTAAGIDARQRIVIVTDPGSPLEKTSQEAGYRAVFNADNTVGGRFSALTAFGLVPAGLAGVDIAGLLDEASAVSDLLAEDSDNNPGLILGAVLGGTGPRGTLRDKVVFNDLGSGVPGFGDWAEQLLAESTGKDGTGLLPVVLSGPSSPELTSGGADILLVNLLPPGSDSPAPAAEETGALVGVSGPLGAQFLLWEYAVSIAGRLLGINPFDQPDVESAKVAARGMLDARPEPTPADAVDGAIEIRATPGLLNGATTVSAALDALLGQLTERGYLAVMAYLNREAEARLAGVRDALAARAGRPVTFGWGPRFLHSTGQFHKGGPAVGVYLQITGATEHDLDVPDRPFTFGQLITAQAAGDASVLADHGRPVLRLHLAERSAGLEQLIAVLSS